MANNDAKDGVNKGTIEESGFCGVKGNVLDRKMFGGKDRIVEPGGQEIIPVRFMQGYECSASAILLSICEWVRIPIPT
jgi:hypothetical protein